jgi:hypothetical protein
MSEFHAALGVNPEHLHQPRADDRSQRAQHRPQHRGFAGITHASDENVPVCRRNSHGRPASVRPTTTRARSTTMPVRQQGTVKGWASGSVCADSVASPVGADPVNRRVVHPAQEIAHELYDRSRNPQFRSYL